MLRTTFSGSPYVGVFARATDRCVVVRPDLPTSAVDALETELQSQAVETTIGGATTVGSLVAGNETGLIVSGRLTDTEHDRLTEAVDGSVKRLPGPINAAGNVIVATDRGAYVHPDLTRNAITTIRETLDVDVERGTIAGVQTVGTAAVATSDGVLCHPEASDSELDRLESLLGVPADVGTINYGAALVGSGLVANANGYVVGEDTSGPELGRIEDALGYVD